MNVLNNTRSFRQLKRTVVARAVRASEVSLSNTSTGSFSLPMSHCTCS